MIPVICFYQSEKYIYSTDYLILSCAESSDVTSFLNEIAIKHESNMKVVQVNFDAFNTLDSQKQPPLYLGAKASVFVLKSYSLLSIREIKIKNMNLLSQNKDFLSQVNFKMQNSKAEFLQAVNRIRSMIANGRIYQVNMTSALKAEILMPAFQFFLLTYENFKGQYKGFLPCENFNLISFSPELFLEKKDQHLRTQPIKGSVSRLENTETSLLKSEKEEAELSMIVDLLRNDLNSLETQHAARVTNHRQLMDLNYIHHTFSEIEIKTTQSLPQILQTVMPGGSISGCPKIESLIAISELENYQRQAYTGTMGWWLKDDFTLNITIRSFVQSQKNYFYYAGCGIVYDSVPEKEFAELLNKTGNLNVQYD